MNKAKLPIKTKIVAWWLRVIGIVLTIWSSGLLLFAIFYSLGSMMDAGPSSGYLIFYFFLWIGSVLTFLSGNFLFKKRPWQQVAMVVLCIAIICFLGVSLCSLINTTYYMIPLISFLGWISCLISRIIIILDRKNYFEMVRQRELEKKGK